MRNTTKLKHILTQFTISIDLLENGNFSLTLVDKTDYNHMHSIEAVSYSNAMAKAYGYFLKVQKQKNASV